MGSNPDRCCLRPIAALAVSAMLTVTMTACGSSGGDTSDAAAGPATETPSSTAYRYSSTPVVPATDSVGIPAAPPVTAPAPAAQPNAAAASTCQRRVTQYRVRRTYPNPYATAGQDPYDGGIRTRIDAVLSGRTLPGPTVIVRYELDNGRSFTETNHATYIMISYGRQQFVTAMQLDVEGSDGTGVACGSFSIPRVTNPDSLSSVNE